MADGDDGRGDQATGDQRWNQADAVNPTAITLLFAEQSLDVGRGADRQHPAAPRPVAAAQTKRARIAVRAPQLGRVDLVRPTAVLVEPDAAGREFHGNAVRM